MENLYRIAYVDESPSDIRRFQRFADGIFEVIGIEPSNEIEETIREITSYNVDALVADFDLMEQRPSIKYFGTDLIEHYLTIRKDFPVFIFTSYEDDALHKGENVNIIYEKGEQYLGGQEENSTPIKNFKLLTRIKIQISKYKEKIVDAEIKIKSLIEKSRITELSIFEEDELTNLDSLIEQSLDNRSITPRLFKNKNQVNKLAELIKKVDDLKIIIDKSNE